MITQPEIREKLVNAGVAALMVFGYPKVNSTNILNDWIYAELFLGILKDTLEEAIENNNQPIIDAVRLLVGEIQLYTKTHAN